MLLKKLTELDGLPMYEEDVTGFIINEIKNYVDNYYIDNMGNLIVIKNKYAKGKHIALSAHMDEVGLIVSNILDNGLILFGNWNCDLRILPSKIVRIGMNKIQGIIGTIQNKAELDSKEIESFSSEDLFIDIGANSKKQAEEIISIGDYIAFDSGFVEFGNDKIKCKAFDNRVGCSIIIKILQSDIKSKITGVFNVQEEVGLRGSKVSSKQVFSDLVLNLEGTISANMPDISDDQTVTVLGNGPAISIMDRTSIYKKEYIDKIVMTAEKNSIPYQFRRSNMGGTDAGSFHIANGGTPVIGISVPCRYIHSPVSVLKNEDYENMFKLIKKFIIEFSEI